MAGWVGAIKSSEDLTALAGGALARVTFTIWKVGSNFSKLLANNIASNLENVSDYFWSGSSNLLSVDGLEDLEGVFLLALIFGN